jgi:hypothetical protein
MGHPENDVPRGKGEDGTFARVEGAKREKSPAQHQLPSSPPAGLQRGGLPVALREKDRREKKMTQVASR